MTSTASPFRRLLKHHRLIWWVFLVSLLLAWMGSLPARAAFGSVLDHSQAAGRLVNGFDMGTWSELTSSPEIPFDALKSAAMAPMAVFLVYLLFLAGGVYASYQSDRKLSLGEFFQACGAHFWRMLRLTLVSLIPFALLAGAFAFLQHWSMGLEENANERLSYYVLWGGLGVLGLLMFFVRAWFDLAQARTVARGERGMFKTALRSFRLVTLRLYGSYLGLGLLRLALTGLLIWIWMGISPSATTQSFLLLQAIVLVHIATRLWQRAASVRAFELVR